MNKILIVTGPVKSFKTTKLAEWASGKNDVLGILQPVINNKRYIKNLSDNKIKMLEMDSGVTEENIIEVGNYRFDAQVLKWAQNELTKAAKLNPAWLIIDEYGKLELDGRGLEPAISGIIGRSGKMNSTQLIIVVRDYLLQKFLNKFKLTKDDYAFLDL